MHESILTFMGNQFTRRRFLRSIGVAAAASVLTPRLAHGSRVHPKPRPGITGAYVLKPEDLQRHKKLIPLYDSVRKIPEIMDGIECSCGCPRLPDFYSLLSCFESNGMARECSTCQEQGRLVVKLHKQGKTLNEIRAALDTRFA